MYTEDSIMTYKDFNSVESKISELNSTLTTLGYTVDAYTPKTWVKKDFLIYTYLNNIENGIQALAEGYYKPYGWREKKTWDKGMSFSYMDVNRWIDNLNLIENEINKHTKILKFNDNVYFSDNTIFG